MHKTRCNALIACVGSVLEGSGSPVTSIGRGIRSQVFDKHRIKRADRLLSNSHLQHETPSLYAAICYLFCIGKRPVIAVDWSDLDNHKKGIFYYELRWPLKASL
jgi:hypothetical protein